MTTQKENGQKAPTKIRSRGGPSPDALAAVGEIMLALHHHNAVIAELGRLSPEGSRLVGSCPVELTKLASTEEGLISFTLSQGENREDFTTDGVRAYGRGGSFRVGQTTLMFGTGINVHNPGNSDLQMLIRTTAPTSPAVAREIDLDLSTRLAERGFSLHEGPAMGYEDSHDVTPLTARHEDGRVLWLSYTQTHDCAEDPEVSIDASGIWLGSEVGINKKLLALTKMSYSECADLGIMPPESLSPVTYSVSGEALETLIDQLPFRTDGPWPLPVIPHAVPKDFFERFRDFEDTSRSVAREIAQVG